MMMPRDLSASVGVHIALILLAVFWSPMMSLQKFDDYSLPIEIITIDEFTRIIAATQSKTPKQALPKKTVAKKTVAEKAVAKQAPPKQVAADIPPPEAATAKKANKSPTARPQFRVAVPLPLARPTWVPPASRQQIAKSKTELNLSQVRALLDKTPISDPAPAPDRQQIDAASSPRLTLSELDAFRAQMQRCWSPPSGARDAESLIVRVRLSLTLAGDILAGPRVVNRTQLSQPFFRTAAESVLRAIRRCQPFKMPPEKYAHWRDIELTFNPSKMLTN